MGDRLEDVSCPGFRIEWEGSKPEYLWVTTRVPTGWVTREHSRAESTFENMIQPTAVIYQGESWLVESVQSVKDGQRYRLVPWPAGEIRRKLFELSPKALKEAAQEMAHSKNQRLLSEWSVYYDWLVGFLPARIQKVLDEELNIDPERATRRSGFVEMLLGSTMAALASIMMIGEKNALAMLPAALGMAMIVEGLARFVQGHTEKVCGCLPLELVDWIYLFLRRLLWP